MRKKLPPEEKKGGPVFVLFRPRERQHLEEVAAQRDMRLGPLLREAFLKLFPLPTED